MGKSTASGNVTAEEFTTPAVVRDAIGRDHLVGPMRNREDLEKELGEVEQGEPKIDEGDKAREADKPADESDQKSSTQTVAPPTGTGSGQGFAAGKATTGTTSTTKSTGK